MLARRRWASWWWARLDDLDGGRRHDQGRRRGHLRVGGRAGVHHRTRGRAWRPGGAERPGPRREPGPPDEKELFRSLGIATAPYATVDSRDDLERAVATVGVPAIFKTRHGGYDGKGQARLATQADVERRGTSSVVCRCSSRVRGVPAGAVDPRGCQRRDGDVGVLAAGREHAPQRHSRPHACPAPTLTPATQPVGEACIVPLLDAPRLCRRGVRRALRRRRRARRQRVRAACAQLRSLDDRGRADQPVRESPPPRYSACRWFTAAHG